MSSNALTATSPGPRAITPISQGSNTSKLQSRVQTPQTPKSVLATPSQPGTWKHPRMEEIARRQNAAAFNKDNVNRAAVHTALLISTFILPNLVYSFLPEFVQSTLAPVIQYDVYANLLIRGYLLMIIALAFKPLYGPKDEMTDIPLTPSQRSLLGLNQASNLMTPGGSYITPPRYSRSATPRSNASERGNSRSPFGSPLTGRERSGSMDRSMTATQRGGSGSPYSGSPLVQKALSSSTSRRLSFDSGSSGLPSTPTPMVNTGRASVGLNNKWLYERGRGSPNGRGLFA